MKIKPVICIVLACLFLFNAGALPVYSAATGSADFVIENGILTDYNGTGGAVTIPAGVTAIGEKAFFECAGLQSIVIPSSVVSIGKSAFKDCGSLESAAMPGSVTGIGESAFAGCIKLKEAVIPNSLTSISALAFEHCSSLTAVTIPGSVISIGEYAFWGCAKLSIVKIPNSVTGIGAGAFGNCSGLKTVSITSGVKTIGINAFKYCGSLKIYCPAGSAAEAHAKANGILYSNDTLVAGITLNPSPLMLEVLKTAGIAAVITPANATNKSLEWISDNTQTATVDNTGVVRGVNPGVAYITCRAKDAGMAQTVCKVTVTRVSLDCSTMYMIPAVSRTLKTSVLPASEAEKGLTWSSSNSSIVTVYQNGCMDALTAGIATITCTSKNGSGAKATCEVTVGKPVVKITVNKTALNLAASDTYSLVATIAPADAGNKSLNWVSSNTKVATVTAVGKVSAVSGGTATITCSAKDGSGVKAACTVTVTSVKLNVSALKIIPKISRTLTASVLPAAAAGKGVTWKSSNTKSVTVDSAGKITTVAYGTAVITCTTKNGTGAKAVCTVTVGKPVAKITLNTASIIWFVGTSGTFKVTVSPADAGNKAVSWSSSNTKVATVDAAGKLKGVGAGTATITCTAKDGSGVKTTCKITVKKPIPLSAPSYRYFTKDSQGHIQIFWNATNISAKTISYMSVTYYFYNAYGNFAFDDLTDENSVTVKYMGPVASKKPIGIKTFIAYSKKCVKVKIGNITVKYTDGTSESFRYDYKAGQKV